MHSPFTSRPFPDEFELLTPEEYERIGRMFTRGPKTPGRVLISTPSGSSSTLWKAYQEYLQRKGTNG